MDKKGTVKILDMGLARVFEGGEAAEDRLTESGQVMGTCDYMAPEQAEDSHGADHRADIYSLGCTLYRIVTGRKPYTGDSLIKILLAHREAPIPSLCEARPDVPASLEAAYQKMVAKTPEDRYQSMTEVIAALEACVAKERQPVVSEASSDSALTSFLQNLSEGGVATRQQAAKVAEETIPSRADMETDGSIWRKILPVDRRQRRVFVGIAAGSAFLVLLFGVVLSLRTPDGTLVVEIDEPDAVVKVLDEEGKVEIERKGGDGKLSISVDLGKYRLRVEKDGFSLFTTEFEGESGGKEVIRARLEPITTAVASKPVPPKPSSPPETRSPSSVPPLAVAPFSPEEAKQHQQTWAKHLGVPVIETNSIGMEMVLIPPGEFMMGSPDSDPEARGWEKAQHKVRITKPFYLAVHETTVGDFRAFVEATAYKTEAETAGYERTWRRLEQTDEHPLVWVSWNDAVAFCKLLSKKEEKTYRLPTEAEWEFACRAGSTTRWCFGDNEGELEKYAWYGRKGGGDIKPVGQKLPNGFDLFDMHGNVREWCSDRFSEDYYNVSSVDDPEGPSGGFGGRVLRGGSFYARPRVVRSAYRFGHQPTYSTSYLGFRPARTYPTGKLTLNITEPNATISFDDAEATFTTPDDTQPIETVLTEGKHTIEVSKAGFKTFKKEINVVADGKETITVQLEPN